MDVVISHIELDSARALSWSCIIHSAGLRVDGGSIIERRYTQLYWLSTDWLTNWLYMQHYLCVPIKMCSARGKKRPITVQSIGYWLVPHWCLSLLSASADGRQHFFSSFLPSFLSSSRDGRRATAAALDRLVQKTVVESISSISVAKRATAEAMRRQQQAHQISSPLVELSSSPTLSLYRVWSIQLSACCHHHGLSTAAAIQLDARWLRSACPSPGLHPGSGPLSAIYY